MLTPLSPQEVQRRLEAGEVRLIDIRETNEYTEIFIPGSRLIPLSIIQKHPLSEPCEGHKIPVFTCRSGRRTRDASPLLEAAAGGEAYMLDGGIKKWEKEGLPVERSSAPMALSRQAQIAAGFLVLLGLLGSTVWHSMYWLSAFVGVGLIFAGVTGSCGLAVLLAKMPWNKRH